MKKQINPTIKAHLVRSAFYVILLLAVCVIPFALAQRNTTKRTVAKSQVAANQSRTATATGLAATQRPNDKTTKASRAAAAHRFHGASRKVSTSPAGVGVCGLVQNSGFETGDFPPWADTGDTSFTFVSTTNPHSGTFSLQTGPATSDGFIDQILPTVAGQAYDVSFWLANDDDTGDNRFGASIGGIVLVPEAVQTAFGYTQFTFTNVIPGDNADLQFIFFNNPSYFYLDDVCVTPSGGASPTPTPSPTPTGCQFNVLIVYSDVKVQPVALHDQIAAEPDVVAVDYFDAEASTPTLAQLTPYNIVVCFSNSSFFDPVGMGDVLADYADAGGTVVAFNFDWFGPPFGLDGRWMTGGYTPFVPGGATNFNNVCLGTYDTTHPLMQGIDPGSLCAFFRHTLTLEPGAVSVAEYQDGEHLCAYQVNNGHTGVGINAYVGDLAGQWSGLFGRVVVNAGRWVGNCGSGGQCTLGAWSFKAPYPAGPLEAPCLGSDGTLLYSAGGFSGITFTPLNLTYSYDPGTDSWTQLDAGLTFSARYATRGVYAPNVGKFYVFGGLDSSFTVTATTQIYDPVSDSWTTGTDMPDPVGRYFPNVAYEPSNGMIYVIGGFDGATFSEQTQTWAYDPTTDTWNTSLTAMPLASGGGGTTENAGKIYVMGGWNGGLGNTTNQVYDVGTDTWSPGAAIPVAYYDPGAAQVSGLIYLIGGGNPSFSAGDSAKGLPGLKGLKKEKQTPSSWITRLAQRLGFSHKHAPDTSYADVRIYDPSSDTWSLSPNSLNQARSFTAASAVGNSAIVVGGFDGVSGDTDTVEKSDCTSGPPPTPTPTPTPSGTPSCTPGSWQEVAAMPIDVYGAAGASDGTFYYSAGGYSFSVGDVVTDFNRYDPVGDSWTPLAPIPTGSSMAVAVYYPPTNKIYVFGGSNPNAGTVNNLNQIYDIATDAWSPGAPLPDVRGFSAGGYSPSTGMIYILSGYSTGFVTDAQPNTWQYDPATDSWTDLTGTAPYPHPAGGFAYGVINGKLYTAGGRDAANLVINDTWEYDPVANAYTQKTDEPGSFQNNVPGSATASGFLWAFGGGNPFAGASAIKAASDSNKAPLNVTKAAFPLAFVDGIQVKGIWQPTTSNSGRFYDPSTDTWTTSPSMNELRSFPTGAAIGESLIIAAGGYNGSSTVASAETEGICVGGSPTPTPTITPPVSPTPTITPPVSPTPTITPPVSPPPTITPPPLTPTPTPTETPRPTPTPRPRPTPHPRPPH